MLVAGPTSVLGQRRRHVVQLHQHLDVHGQTRQPVVRVRVHREPRQHVVALEHEAQHVGGDVRVERMFRRRLGLRHRVVVVLQDLEAVQVERDPQKHRTDVLQVGTGRPEPGRHAAGRGRRDEVADGHRLLGEGADLWEGGEECVVVILDLRSLH